MVRPIERAPGHCGCADRDPRRRAQDQSEPLLRVRRWPAPDADGARRRLRRRHGRAGAADHRGANCAGGRTARLRGAAGNEAPHDLRHPGGDAFVDFSRELVAGHSGGSTNELLTVYSIVNALCANLPAVHSVELLVDGKQVETLAGHVDLRRPLEKNLAWVQ